MAESLAICAPFSPRGSSAHPFLLIFTFFPNFIDVHSLQNDSLDILLIGFLYF